MLTTVLALVAVLVALTRLAVERGALARPSPEARAWEKHRLSWRDGVLGGAFLVAVNAPLLSVLPALLRAPQVLLRDAHTHAPIVRAIATWGLGSGWIDATLGGFPAGVHYPMLGWLAAAALVKLGLSPGLALQLVAVGALLATPALAFALARRAGAGALPALYAAGALSLVQSYLAFVGGYETHLAMGLFAQATSVPFVVALAYTLATDGPRYRAPLAGALCLLAHPQIALAAVVCAALPLLASSSRAAVERLVLATLAMGLVGAAVFGPGTVTLGVPFGWPRFNSWAIVGIPPERLEFWIEEHELLDDHRPPVLTVAWIASFVVCAALARRRTARAVVLLTLVTLTGSVIGPTVQRLGRVGTLLLSFVQPLRVVAMLPLCLALVLVVVGREGGAWLVEALAPRWGEARVRRGLTAAGAALLAASCLVALRGRASFLATFAGPVRTRCAQHADANVLRSWVRGLTRGRLWYDVTGPLSGCADAGAFVHDSAVPVSITPAVGAHVGVLFLAAKSLRPGVAGDAARAEALATRYVLHAPSQPLADGDAWRVIHRHRDAMISERVGGTDVVGVGCRAERWSGSDAALREALHGDLDGASRTLDPRALIELRTERLRGALLVEPVREPCDASNARVEEDPTRAPGRFAATVTTPAPVDVVVRATNYPWWHVYVDGHEERPFAIAPGYFGVRVGPGRHAVLAQTRVPLGYSLGIALAALLVGALCVPMAAWRRLVRRGQ